MRTEPHFDRGRIEPINNGSGLVLHLNDNGKTTDKWMDRSGKNNHGTVFGAATGTLGYVFDGVDDYVNAGNNAILNAYNYTEYSVFGWVKTNDNTKYQNWIGQKRVGDALWIGQTSNIYANAFSFRWLSSTGNVQVDSARIIKNGVWYFIVSTYKKNNSVKLYVNGALVESKTIGELSTSTFNNIIIGVDPRDSTGDVWTGSIDDVCIYNRALSRNEITEVFQSTRKKFGV